MLVNFYQNKIIKKPIPTLILLGVIIIISFYFSKNFRLDASSETLLLEGDPDLKYLNEINKRYNSKEFLVLTYSPKSEMISDKSINNLLSLKYKIQSLDWVHNVITILDVPLLNSTDKTLNEKLRNFSTLKSDGIDRESGFLEILNSPVFKNFVVSEDGKTSGIIVYIKQDNQINEIKDANKLEEYKNLKKKTK